MTAARAPSTALAPLPVAVEPIETEGEGSTTRNRAIVIAGVATVVLLLLGVLTLLVVRGDSGGKQQATVKPASVLAQGDRETLAVLADFEAATTLAQIDQAANHAATASTAVETAAQRADLIEDAKARSLTRKVLANERAVLASFAGLRGYGGDNLQQWVLLSAAADQKVQVMGTQFDQLETVADYRAPHDLPQRITKTRQSLDATLKPIADQLSAWRNETAKVKADKDRQLAALDQYAGAVRSQLSRYSGLRRDMQDFVDRVDSDGVTYDEAYRFLSNAGSQRSAVRASLAALTAPPNVQTAQGGLITVLDTAVSAISDATSGISQYQTSTTSTCDYYYDFCYEDSTYAYYKDTPGWQTFTSKSNQITSSFDSAKAAWEQAVSSERGRISGIALPPKPQL